ncbi:MAG: hypothetical protein EBS20_10670, partial [Actinobacteria bacterium]|nr:hypothetical protein [Actinomycetota bacterium]
MGRPPIEALNRIIHVSHHSDGAFGHVLPFPFVAKFVVGDRHDVDALRRGIKVSRGGSGDMDARAHTPTTTSSGHRVHGHANKVISARRRDTHRVHRVAHLAVERVLDRGRQTRGLSIIGGDHPCTTGAVQADR